MKPIPYAKYEKAAREAKAALRGEPECHLRGANGSCWHPAVVVSKQSLRILLAIAEKAEVM